MIKSFVEFIKESKESNYIDNILDKINKVGMGKLSKQEQEILMKYSSGSDISDLFQDQQTQPTTSPNNTIIFEVADEVIVINKMKGKLPDEIYNELMSKDSHIIQRINERGKIDIGLKMPNGEAYLFNASRFTLKNDGTQSPTQNPKKGPYIQAQEIQEPPIKDMKKNFIIIFDRNMAMFLDAQNEPIDFGFIMKKYPILSDYFIEKDQIIGELTAKTRPDELIQQLRKQGFLTKIGNIDRFL